MSARPDITGALAPGETLLWQGHPQPGRRVPVRATVFASVFFMLTAILMVGAWGVALWLGHIPVYHTAVFLMIALAALFTFFGLRVTLLDRRRARARDRRTAYAITDARALALTGPYSAAVALGPGVAVGGMGDTITIAGGGTDLRFERLDDAPAARDILRAQIEGRA